MYVKPADGLNVPDPERGGLLAAAGRKVDPTTYWHKRVQCGDVKVITVAEHEQLLAKAAADKEAADKAAAEKAAAEEKADKPAAEAAAVQSSAQSADKAAKPGK